MLRGVFIFPVSKNVLGLNLVISFAFKPFSSKANCSNLRPCSGRSINLVLLIRVTFPKLGCVLIIPFLVTGNTPD